MSLFTDADLIHAYGPEQALEDGMLVDASQMGATSHHPQGIVVEAGLPYRTVLTVGVADLVRPNKAEAADGQDMTGRLWDTLHMAVMMGAYRHAARKANEAGIGSAFYKVVYRLKGRADIRGGQRTITLKIGVSRDIVGEPIITIMLPHED